jgi:hypothetical protein
MCSFLPRPKYFQDLLVSREGAYPQYEFGHSLQRWDVFKKTRRQIVWNGFVESSVSDPSNFPQGRQEYPLSCAVLHTSVYKIVFPKLDPSKIESEFRSILSFKAMNHRPGSGWRKQPILAQDFPFQQIGVSYWPYIRAEADPHGWLYLLLAR